MSVSNETRKQILDEIIDIIHADDIAPDEFTITQFIEQSGFGRRHALTVLDKLVERGVLKSRQALVKGRHCNVYRKTNNENRN